MFASDHWHNRFSLDRLGYRLRSVPMLLILLPFVAGILFSDYYVLPLWFVYVAMLLMVVVAWMAMPRRVVYGYVGVVLMLLGYAVADLRAPEVPLPYDHFVDMVVEVDSPPEQRDGYRVADGVICSWRDGDEWRSASSRVRLWLHNDDLRHGDEVHMVGALREHVSRYADYDKLMHRRDYIGGVSVDSSLVSRVRHHKPSGLHHYAVERLGGHVRDRQAGATVLAMVAGSRSGMSPSLREDYSRTGLSHLLAVSGLHLGIVLMVVSVLLRPLYLVHRGHRVAALISIVAIWLFASMSGMSPSVVRAAVMLSILQLSLLSSANYSSLNALAVTIFAMLVFRPNYLFDISFQLSVMAVFGIVAWGVPLVRSMRSWPWLLRGLASTFAIGVVATLWTLPLVSHTFDNVPLIGVIITPLMLLFAYMIVGCGLFVLLLPEAIARPFAIVAEWAAGVQNGVVGWAADLPYASVSYTMPMWGVAMCYMFFAIITLMLWSLNRKKVVTLPHYDYLVGS